jgi:hypothetical protein
MNDVLSLFPPSKSTSFKPKNLTSFLHFTVDMENTNYNRPFHVHVMDIKIIQWHIWTYLFSTSVRACNVEHEKAPSWDLA